MNFTKEYIALTKSEKVQGLRPELQYGDRFLDEYNEVFITTKYSSRVKGKYIWLPTGDQLDEEIVKVCEGKSYNYDFNFEINRTYGNSYYAGISDGEYLNKYSRNFNPLTAKISLLIKLLEVQ